MEILILLAFIISVLFNIKLFFDLNRSKNETKKLEELVTIDRITKVNNKYKIELILEEQIFISKRYDRHLCMIQFSIDNFKEKSEEYGDKLFNNLLKEFVTIVQNEIRLSDVLGRWSEEEFCIVLPETSMIHGVMLAEKLRQKIETYSFGEVGNITASFGVTIFNDRDQIQTFISRVQSALYKAKKDDGVNKVEVI